MILKNDANVGESNGVSLRCCNQLSFQIDLGLSYYSKRTTTYVFDICYDFLKTILFMLQ